MSTILSRRCLRLSLPAFVLLSASTLMHADTILNENFDELTPGQALTSAGVFTAINGTNIDVVSNGGPFGNLCRGPESGNCLDLAGSGGNSLGNIELTTALNLAPGAYHLSFDLIGSQRGDISSSTTVIFGSWSKTFVLSSSDVTDGIVDVDVTLGGGPTQLEFINNGVAGASSDVGALLDNVSISTTSPVPEPGSLGLMVTGLLGIGGVVRRRLSQ
jgi:hypothetical protein